MLTPTAGLGQKRTFAKTSQQTDYFLNDSCRYQVELGERRPLARIAPCSRQWTAYPAPVHGIQLMNSEFITSVPYLHTERLMLREYRREDFDLFAAHCADPVSSAHLGPA